MKIKYNLLWFEDDTDYIDSFQPLIEEYLEDLGFFPVLNIISGAPNNLIDILEMDNWDLILMDYYLSVDSEKGDELIDRIRNHELFTEIIFYSEDQNFRDKLRETQLEGVYFSRGRERLLEKIKKIITLTLKKSQDVNNIRGLVIAETIDIEYKMDQLLLSYFGIDDEKKIVFGKILEPKFDVLSIKKKYDIILKICKAKKTYIDTQIKEFSAEKKEEKEKFIKELELLDRICKEFKNVNEEIIMVRNILAHALENVEQKNTLISEFEKEPIIIDDEWCKKTRKHIQKHSQNIDKILNFIKL